MTETTGLPANFEINEHTLADPAYAPVLDFIEAHVNELRFTALPDDLLDDFEAYLFYITVTMKSPGRWAVMDRNRVLTDTGEWDWEPQPSSRTDEWKQHTRFPLAQAITLAKQKAREMRIGGYSLEAFAEMARQRQAEAMHNG